MANEDEGRQTMAEGITNNERQKEINELLSKLKEGEDSVKSPEDLISHDKVMKRFGLTTPHPPLIRGDAACRQ